MNQQQNTVTPLSGQTKSTLNKEKPVNIGGQVSKQVPDRNTENGSFASWLIFFFICIPIFVGSVDLTSIVVVLPQATLDLLGPKGLNKADQALWAVTAYLLAYTVSLTLVGRLSDNFPRKRVFLICGVIFSAGAVWAGFATGLPLQLLKLLPIWPDLSVLPLISLIMGRVVQAIGAGACVSVGMALVSDIFPAGRRARAISLIGAIDSLGWVVGNLYAGFILQLLPAWRFIFLINAAIVAVTLVLIWFALRKVQMIPAADLTGNTKHQYDVRGAMLFTLTLTLLVVGLEMLVNVGLAATLLIASAIVAVIFVRLQSQSSNTLFDMAFIRQPDVYAALITNLLVGFGLILIVAGVPLMMNLRSLFLRGENLLTGALWSGVMLLALTIPLILAALVGESRYHKVGAAIPVSMGLLVALVGFSIASLWHYTIPNYVIVFSLALVGAGLGLTIGPLTLTVIETADASRYGLAASLVLMMRLLGIALGTPLAATLTITLANQWATERVAGMNGFYDVARSMLIPPMATDALAHMMLLGVLACLSGFIVFYLPRALHDWRTGLRPHGLSKGSFSLVISVILVGLVAVWESQSTPTIVPNPIARQLPANATIYAALNIQQVFLKNTQKPLQAVVDAIRYINSPALTAQNPQSAQPTQDSTQSPTLSPTLSSPAPTQGSSEQPTANTTTNAASSLDDVIRVLFRTQHWTIDSYKPFCPDDTPRQAWEWQDCFTSSILGWVGPQVAFAMLPSSNGTHNFVLAFQTTSRNNAIRWVTNLASALGEKEPTQTEQNTYTMTINGSTTDERRIAITQTYVLFGTPEAINQTLHHGNTSLADESDYQQTMSGLPDVDFATVYLHYQDFATDVQPTLTDITSNQNITTVLGFLTKFSPQTNPNFASTKMGLAMRVDEEKFLIDLVADPQFSLQSLHSAAVPPTLLALIPSQSKAWSAFNVNIAMMVQQNNLPNLLGRILPADPLNVVVSKTIGNSLQNVLSYAKTGILFTQLPTLPSTSAPSDMIVAIPMSDTPLTVTTDTNTSTASTTAKSAVEELKARFQALSALSFGSLIVENSQVNGNSITSVTGKTLVSFLPNGFQFTLTKDNLLVIATGNNLSTYFSQLDSAGKTASSQLQNIFPAPSPYFWYTYIDPGDNINLTAVAGGVVQQDRFTLNLVLKTK